MKHLSGSPFGFNKIINPYLLASRHNRIRKKTKINNKGLIFHLTDIRVDKVIFEGQFTFLT